MQLQKDNYLTEIIEEAGTIAVVISPKGAEALGAGVAFACYIEERFNKKVAVLYKGSTAHFNSKIFEAHEVLTDTTSTTLKVVLDYSGTNIEAVDYYKQENSKLVLEIKPVDRNFDMDRIKFEFEGSDFDLIITIGVQKIEELKEILGDSNKNFTDIAVVNIDNSHNNQNYGKINIVDFEADSLVTLVMQKMVEWGYTPSKTVAKTLLASLNGAV
jgi:nanoRNase/pAp phosphatase (c-di-AMP/oligoRNAs hydrolase)